MNLYGAVDNNTINFKDYLGLATVKTQDCEILIYVSHYSDIDGYSISERSKCGIASCTPSKTNSNIKPENKISGYPDHGNRMWGGPNPSVKQHIDSYNSSSPGGISPALNPENEHGMENAVFNMLKNIGPARRELCCKGCTNVRVILEVRMSDVVIYPQGRTLIAELPCPSQK